MSAPYKLSLQATTDHHGLSVYSGHFNSCEKIYRNDDGFTEYEMIETINSSTK